MMYLMTSTIGPRIQIGTSPLKVESFAPTCACLTNQTMIMNSGGHIIISNGSGHRHDLLVGLLSWGIGCADSVFPGLNARVSDVSDWIDEVVCTLSESLPKDFCLQEKASNRTHLYSIGVGGYEA